MENETVNTSSKDFQTLFLHSYFIINTSPVGAVGQHWLLLSILRPQVFLKRQLKTLFCVWDPLGKRIQNYTSFLNIWWHFSKRLALENFLKSSVLCKHRIQTCGLHCLHMAHYSMRLADQHSIKLETFHSQFVTLLEPLKQMQEIDLVLFCNDHCKTMLMYKVTWLMSIKPMNKHKIYRTLPIQWQLNFTFDKPFYGKVHHQGLHHFQ